MHLARKRFHRLVTHDFIIYTDSGIAATRWGA